MIPNWDAATYFQRLAEAVVRGDVDDILSRADSHLAFYVSDRLYIFRDRDRMARGLREYCRFLKACGVVGSTVETAELQDRRGTEASFDVRARYHNAQGKLVGESHTFYYLRGLETGAVISIMDLKSLPVPLESLPFDIADFE